MYVIVCMGKFKYQPKNMAKIIMRKYFAIPLLTQIFIVFSVISNKYCTCVHFDAYTVTQLLFLYHGQIQFGQYFPNTLHNNLNKP